MSLFNLMVNRGISLENEELVPNNGVEVQEDASIDETEVETQDAADPVIDEELSDEEVEQVVEEAERSELIADELEQQNAAVQNLVETNGALTENEAAMTEAARRTAVVGLGLDPDAGAGAEIVDEAGLESMVLNPGTVALESTTTAIARIRKLARDIKAKYRK